MFKTTFKGLDEFQRKLERLQTNAKALNGSVPISEILTPSFMSKYTKFSSIEAMFNASPFKIDSTEDLQAAPEQEFDAFVRENSQFSSWQVLLSAAGKEYAERKLFS